MNPAVCSSTSVRFAREAWVNVATWAVGALLLAAPATAETMRLEELAGRSGWIGTGSVARLHRSDDRLRVRFAVEQTLEGEPAATVTFIAPDLWSEPAFSKQKGRRLLVFLERTSDDRSNDWQLVSVAADRLAYFELFESSGNPFVVLWTDALELPSDVPTTESTLAPGFINNVPFRPFLASLRRILAARREAGPAGPDEPEGSAGE